ncbi:toll/interleukin-1 receptor domain-containing protein [Aquirufa ecclesiirivi]
MSHKFFISHYSKDRTIAELFSSALRRISLEQIDPWFSSDSTGDSGLKPGDIWFNQILAKITQSKCVVALLTPNSIDRTWVYFESGIGQALPNCEVIPICIGIKRDSILPPLGLYQCYQLNDYRSVVEFFSKLLTLFEIKFDEEMSRIVIEKLIADISQISFEKEPLNEIYDNKQSVEKLIENFKSHIDKRFLEVIEKPRFKNSNQKTILRNTESETSYSVLFDIDFNDFKNEGLYIDIRSNDSFQDVTNTLYFMISNYVRPFRYLIDWIIIEKETEKHVIIREVSENIPATYIFKPETKWRIVKLKKPYNALESFERIKVYYNN